MSDCCRHLAGNLPRRGFTKLIFGAEAALWGGFRPGIVRAAGDPEALLPSCMDCRLMDDIVIRGSRLNFC